MIANEAERGRVKEHVFMKRRIQTIGVAGRAEEVADRRAWSLYPTRKRGRRFPRRRLAAQCPPEITRLARPMRAMSNDAVQQYARLQVSCNQCRHLRKKCDKQRPTCALCLRRGRRCSFMALTNSGNNSESPSRDNPSPLSTPDYKTSITATYYLDYALLSRSVGQLPEVQFGLDPALLSYLGDYRSDHSFVSHYFAVTHPWMPFLSRTAFMERILNPLGSAWPWNIVLLAAMKLLTTAPSGPTPRSTFYTTLKANVAAAVDSGLLELRIFQAMLLIAAYEMGHGIYPAAYMTVGTCFRYGNALGLGRSIEKGAGCPRSNIEVEEQRRSWWTVLLLDKYLSLSLTDRRPAATCPGQDATLPADDALWDMAEQTEVSPHRLSEPLSAAMGRFCLTAQAAILLERILQNINDRSSPEEFHEQEAKTLDDTAAALTSVALQEARMRGMTVCSPITACYSARLLLHDPERAASRPQRQPHDHTLNGSPVESEIAAVMLKIARTACTSSRCGEEEYTPFCFDALYRSGVFFARRYRSAKSHADLEAFESIKEMLGIVNSRWMVAGLYRQMLEARSISGIL